MGERGEKVIETKKMLYANDVPIATVVVTYPSMMACLLAEHR